MSAIRHYSFDLWLTLIRSNDSFKRERAYYFFRRINRLKKNLDEVVEVFRSVDLMCNAINEKTGGNIEAEEMYLMCVDLINEGQYPIREVDLPLIMADMEEMFYYYHPMPFSNDTAEALNRLRSREGITMNILSNTGFIKGEVLRRLLEILGFDGYFDFQLYSDELGMSKPNPALFRHLLDELGRLTGGPVDPQSVLHIGDNPHTDVFGAGTAGMQTLLVNSNQTSILSLVHS